MPTEPSDNHASTNDQVESTRKLVIEIFSDIVCPWCFIGKRRLDTVLASELGDQLSIRWRPYQLHPNMPAAGVDRIAYLKSRYGEDADRGRIPERIAVEAEQEGIKMDFTRMTMMPKTLLAHRLMEYGYEQGDQHALSETLFQAHFCNGQDVGSVAGLCEIAAQHGYNREVIQAYLESDNGEAEVAQQLARAPELGVSGVPGYYLGNSFLLPGAQTSEVMTQIIGRVISRIAQGKMSGGA